MTKLARVVTVAGIAVCFCRFAWAQDLGLNVGRYDKDDEWLVRLLESRARNEMNELNAATSYYKSYMKAAHEYVMRNLDKHHYIHNDSLEGKLASVFGRLCEANGFKQELVLLISDDPSMNAHVNVVGVFQFTIGLMTQVKNDDELAFVVAHELAHRVKYHAADRIYDFHDLNVAAVHRAEFEKITRGKGTLYGLNTMQSVTYKLQENRRKRELMADSLAIFYMEKASFSPTYGLGVFTRLGYRFLDHEESGRSVLQTLFSPKYPPRDYWFHKRLPSFDISPVWLYNRDSVASHPDLDARVERLGKTVGFSDSTNASYLLDLSDQAYYELVKGAFTNRQYEACLYLALKARRKYPHDAFFTSVISSIFLDLSQALSDHNPTNNIHMYLNYYTVNLSDNLKEVNAFLYNLLKEEMLEIGYHFLNNPQTFDPERQEHYWLLNRYAELTDRSVIAEKIKAMYQSKFASNPFYKL